MIVKDKQKVFTLQLDLVDKKMQQTQTEQQTTINHFIDLNIWPTNARYR